MSQHVNILLHKLVELQSNHAFPNTDLSDAVRMMKNEFMSIQPLLFQAERKIHKLNDKIIQGWLMQLMDLVQDVEDVFDIFNLDTLSSKSHDCFYNKLLHSLSSSQRSFTVRGKINDFHSEDRKPEASFMIRGDRGIINYVKYNITEAVSGFVYVVAATYGTLLGLDNTQILLKFSNKITNDLKWVRRYFPKKYKPTTKMMTSLSGHAPQILFESPGIIGRQDELSMLRDKLRLRKTDETSTANLMLVIVTGKAGIGKTALVNEFYKQTKHQYAWYAWVNASEISNLCLLRNMLKGFLKSQYMKDPINMNARDEVWLKDRIQRCLNGKKFLLVLDDVSSYQWKSIKDALPCGSDGRIVVTSRGGRFESSKPVIFQLKRLKLENGKKVLFDRSLFGRRVLKTSQSDWKKVALEILITCLYNPLAIATIGGMLSMKDMKISEWMKVSKRLKQVDFLTLCYNDLPPILKSCLHYAAMFAPSSKISCNKMERLWSAEGLIQLERTGDVTKENMAKFQRNELIRRNMFQVVRFRKNGEPKYCEVLQPIRDLCSKLSREYPNKRLLQLTLQDGTSNNKRNYLLNTNLMSGLHSFLSFGEGNLEKLTQNWPSKFKLLSVLDLQDVSIKTLPSTVGYLGLLKYLGLRRTNVVELPSSVNKLHRLITLDVRDTLLRVLPSGMESLGELRHLLLANSFGKRVVTLNADVAAFKNLQKITGVRLTDDIGKGLMNMSQLQKLSVGKVKSYHSKQLGKSIDKMKLLKSLTIKADIGDQIQLETRSPLNNLETLRVGGHVKDILSWVTKIKSLKLLYVWDSLLPGETFATLQNLPNLLVLSICNAYVGEKIVFDANSFKNLKKLSIIYCMKLNEWKEIPKGAMPILEKLTIGHCPKLLTLPNGLKDLVSLRSLQVTGMPEQFSDNAKLFHNSQLSVFVQKLPNLDS